MRRAESTPQRDASVAVLSPLSFASPPSKLENEDDIERRNISLVKRHPTNIKLHLILIRLWISKRNHEKLLNHYDAYWTYFPDNYEWWSASQTFLQIIWNAESSMDQPASFSSRLDTDDSEIMEDTTPQPSVEDKLPVLRRLLYCTDKLTHLTMQYKSYDESVLQYRIFEELLFETEAIVQEIQQLRMDLESSQTAAILKLTQSSHFGELVNYELEEYKCRLYRHHGIIHIYKLSDPKLSTAARLEVANIAYENLLHSFTVSLICAAPAMESSLPTQERLSEVGKVLLDLMRDFPAILLSTNTSPDNNNNSNITTDVSSHPAYVEIFSRLISIDQGLMSRKITDLNTLVAIATWYQRRNSFYVVDNWLKTVVSVAMQPRYITELGRPMPDDFRLFFFIQIVKRISTEIPSALSSSNYQYELQSLSLQLNSVSQDDYRFWVSYLYYQIVYSTQHKEGPEKKLNDFTHIPYEVSGIMELPSKQQQVYLVARFKRYVQELRTGSNIETMLLFQITEYLTAHCPNDTALQNATTAFLNTLAVRLASSVNETVRIPPPVLSPTKSTATTASPRQTEISMKSQVYFKLGMISLSKGDKNAAVSNFEISNTFDSICQCLTLYLSGFQEAVTGASPNLNKQQIHQNFITPCDKYLERAQALSDNSETQKQQLIDFRTRVTEAKNQLKQLAIPLLANQPESSIPSSHVGTATFAQQPPVVIKEKQEVVNYLSHLKILRSKCAELIAQSQPKAPGTATAPAAAAPASMVKQASSSALPSTIQPVSPVSAAPVASAPPKPQFQPTGRTKTEVELKIIGAKNIFAADSEGTSDPFIIINTKSGSVPKDKTVTKVIKKTVNPVWNEVFTLPLRDRKDALVLQCFDDDMLGKDDLGSCEIGLDLFTHEKPTPMTMKLSKQGEVQVVITLRLADRELVEVMQQPVTQSPTNAAQVLPTGRTKTEVEVKLVGAKNLFAADSEGTSDPFVIINTKSGSAPKDKTRSKVLKKTVNPVWNEVFTLPLRDRKDALLVQCFDDDMLGKDDLGSCEIALDLFTHEKPTPMTLKLSKQGEIQVVITLRLSDKELAEAASKPASQQAAPQLAPTGRAKTEVEVKLIGAKNLFAADSEGTSDPFVTINTKSGSVPKDKTKTKVIKKTVNPVWNEVFTLPLRDRKDALVLQCFDDDMLGKDDLGSCEIGLDLFVHEKPTPMTMKLSKQGEIQVMVTLKLSDSELAQVLQEPTMQPAVSFLNSAQSQAPAPTGRTKTEVEVKLVGAKNLFAADSEGTSDPFVTVNTKSGSVPKDNIKSKVIKKTVNPVWNEIFTIPLRDSKDALVLQCFDDDMLGKDDLGSCEIGLDLFAHEKPTPMTMKLSKQGEIQVVITLRLSDKELVEVTQQKATKPVPENVPAPTGRTKTEVEVKLVGAKNLFAADSEGTSDPFVTINTKSGSVPKDKLKSKILKKTLNPVWNEVFTVPLLNRKDALVVQCFDDDMLGKDDLGSCEIGLDLFTHEKPTPMTMKLSKQGEVELVITLRLSDKELAEVVQNQKAPQPASVTGGTVAPSAPVPTGRTKTELELRLIGAKNLFAADSEGTSDPFIIVNTKSGSVPKDKTKTKIVKKTVNPIWNEVFTIPLKDRRDIVTLQCLDDDMMGNDDLGSCEIALDLFRHEKPTPMTLKLSKQGEVEFVATLKLSDRELAEEVDKPSVVSSLTQPGAPVLVPTGRAKTEVEVKLVGAKNLFAADSGGTSDPFVIVNTKSGSVGKDKTKTKVIKKTVNPVWNEVFTLPLRDRKDALVLQCFDDDMLGKDDLGSCEIGLDLFTHEKPTPMTMKLSKQGEIELVITLRLSDKELAEVAATQPELSLGTAAKSNASGSVDNAVGTAASNQAASISTGQAITEAEVKLVGAKNLGAADSNPFVVINTKSGSVSKDKTKSKILKKTANPIWNEVFTIPLQDKKDSLLVQCYSDGMFSKTDIGNAEVTLQQLVHNTPTPVTVKLTKQGEVELVITLRLSDKELAQAPASAPAPVVSPAPTPTPAQPTFAFGTPAPATAPAQPTFTFGSVATGTQGAPQTPTFTFGTPAPVPSSAFSFGAKPDTTPSATATDKTATTQNTPTASARTKTEVEIKLVGAQDLFAADSGGTSDPFVIINTKSGSVGKDKTKTKVIKKTVNPVWNEVFTIPLKDRTDIITLQCFDDDMIGKDDLGSCEIGLDLFTHEKPTPMTMKLSKQGEVELVITLRLSDSELAESLKNQKPASAPQPVDTKPAIPATPSFAFGTPAPATQPAPQKAVEPAKSEMPAPTGRTKTEVEVKVVGAKDLFAADSGGTSDPFVIINTKSGSVGKDKTKTKIVKKTVNPVWNEVFTIPLKDRKDALVLQCFDDDMIGKDDLGLCEVTLESLAHEKPTPMTVKLSKQGEVELVITLKLSDKELAEVSQAAATPEAPKPQASSALPAFGSGATGSVPPPSFSFGGTPAAAPAATPAAPTFSFGTPANQVQPAAPTFSFGTAAAKPADAPQIAPAQPTFTFGQPSAPAAKETVPPKPAEEAKPVQPGVPAKTEQLAQTAPASGRTKTEVEVKLVGAKDLFAADSGGTSDPFVTFNTKSGSVGKDKTKSKVIKKTVNPVWNEVFTIPLKDRNDTIVLNCFDDDMIGKDDLGTGEVTLSQLENEKPTPMTVKLSKQGEVELVITLRLSDKELAEVQAAPKITPAAPSPSTNPPATFGTPAPTQPAPKNENTLPAETKKDTQALPPKKEETAAPSSKTEQTAQPTPLRRAMTEVEVKLVGAKDLFAADSGGTSDPFVVFNTKSGSVGKDKTKSKIVKKTVNPVWNEVFTLPLKDKTDIITLQCFDDDMIGKDDLGSCEISVSHLENDKPTPMTVKLSKQGEVELVITLRLSDKEVDEVAKAVKNESLKSAPAPQPTTGAPAAPATQATPAAPTFSTPATGPAPSQATPSTPTFAFGTPAPATPAAPTFTFGTPATPANQAQPAPPTFSFGTPAAKSTEPPQVVPAQPAKSDPAKTVPKEQPAEAPKPIQPATPPTKTEQTTPTPVAARTKTEMEIKLIGAKDLFAADSGGTSDPFVIINTKSGSVPKDKTKTKIVKKTVNPVWNEVFTIPLKDRNDTIVLNCFDDDMIGKDDLGSCEIAANQFQNEKPTPMTVKLSKQGEVELVITLKLSDKELVEATEAANEPKVQQPVTEAKPVPAPAQPKQAAPPVKTQQPSPSTPATGRTKTEVEVKLVGAKNLFAADSGGTSDPFVIINTKSGSAPKDKTKSKIVKKTVNPVWNEIFTIPLKDRNDTILLQCWDDDMFGKDDLGTCEVSVSHVPNEKPTPMTVKLSKQGEVELIITLKLSDKELAEVTSAEAEEMPLPSMEISKQDSSAIGNDVAASNENLKSSNKPLRSTPAKDEEAIKKEAEEKAKKELEEKAQREKEAQEKAQREKEAQEKAKQEAEEKARKEAEEKAQKEAQEKAQKEAEEKARQESEEKARIEKARQEAERKAKQEAEEKARKDAEEKARQEEQARKDAEEKARLEAEEKARLKAEEKAKKEAEEKARLKAEEQARQEEQARRDEEERARLDAEEKARKEAEQKARQEAELKAKQEAEEKARKEAELKAKQEAEEEARKEAEEQARKNAEEKARKEAEEQARKEAEEKAQKEAEDKARLEAEEKTRKEAELKAKQEAEEKARQEEQARKDAEEKAKQESEEKARKEAEEQATKEAEENATLKVAPEQPTVTEAVPQNEPANDNTSNPRATLVRRNSRLGPQPTTQCLVKLIAGANLKAADSNGLSDPFVIFSTKSNSIPKNKIKSKIIKETLNPIWNETFTINLQDRNDVLILECYDDDLIGKDFLGSCKIPMDTVKPDTVTPFTLPLSLQGEIRVEITLTLSDKEIGVVPRPHTTAVLQIIKASDLKAADSNGLSDPFVIINTKSGSIPKDKTKTKIIPKTLNPTWNEVFTLILKDRKDVIVLNCYDDDLIGKDFLGKCELDMSLFENDTPTKLTLPLTEQGMIELSVTLQLSDLEIDKQ